MTVAWEPAGMVTEDQVRQLALDLPGAREQPSYGGRPSWRTAPRVFAWLREDPEALVVWVATEEAKQALLAASAAFFTTAHYDGSPVVLVHLDAVDVREVAELLVDSWTLRAPRSLTRPVEDLEELVATLVRSLHAEEAGLRGASGGRLG